jgi:hypothetical protein
LRVLRSEVKYYYGFMILGAHGLGKSDQLYVRVKRLQNL